MSKKHRYPCMRSKEEGPTSPERRKFLHSAAAAGLVAGGVAGGVAGAACKKGADNKDSKTEKPAATPADKGMAPPTRPTGPGASAKSCWMRNRIR